MEAYNGVSVEGARAENHGDKCSSHGDLPPVSVGNGIGVDCNSDGNDSFVLVNGSDVAKDRCESVSDPRESFEGSRKNGNIDDLSEASNGDPIVGDLAERIGDKEVGSSELRVDSPDKVEEDDVVVNGAHHSEAVNGDGDVLNNEVKIDDLKSENGEINLHVEAIVENGKSRIENGGITQVEGEVSVNMRESDITEENCSKPLTNGFSHGESCIQNGDDCNSLVNGASSTVLSDGDKPGNMLEPCTSSSENNEFLPEIPLELTGDMINGPESPKSEAVECQIAEDDAQSHVADVVGDVEALDCKHQLVHEEVPKMQASHSDSEDTHFPDSSVSETLDTDVKESLVNDAMSELEHANGECKELGGVEVEAKYQEPELKPANGECKELGGFEVEAKYQQHELKPANGQCEELGVEREAMFHQPELKPANGEFEELGGVDADATVTGQGELELPEVIENQEPSSNNFEAAISEIPETAEVVEVKGQADMSSLIAVLEGTDNSNGAGSVSAGIEKVVCDGVGNDDISNNELSAEVDQSLENSMGNVQSDTTDKASIELDMERVDVNGTLEFIAEEAGAHKTPVEDDITMDQVAEDSGSVDVQDKEIVLEEARLERNVEVEETSQSNLQAADNAAMYNLGATTNDLCGVETPVNKVSSDVIPNQAVSASDEGSDIADGELRRPVDTAVCLSDPSELDSVTEQEQGCSANDSTSSKNNMENSATSLHALDAKLQKASGTDVYVVNRSNDMSNNIRKPTISFGSFECEAPFSYGDVNAQPEVLNQTVVIISSKSKVEPSDGASFLTSKGNGIHLTEFGTGKASEEWSDCASNTDSTPLLTSEANEVHLTKLGPGKAPEGLSEEHESNSNAPSLSTSEANEVYLTESGPGKASKATVEHASNGKLLTFPVKASGPDILNGRNLGTESARRPFHYLIRIPRHDDENLAKEISLHESKVDEKTQTRKSVQDEWRKAKVLSDDLRSDFEAAIAEERAAWDLLRAKQNEVKSAKSLINLARNAVTIEDVQNQILNMERKIEHETLNLNEEKQLIREIKQMKILKSQLNANKQNQEKVLQALGQSVEVEERLKVLKKELEPLQDKHTRAKQRVDIAKKKLDEQKPLQNELLTKLRSADSVQQKAYEDRKTLKQQWFDKNKIFYKYKDDAKAAYDLAEAGDKDRLEQHCVNQVEKIMELWNKNDDFRKEYIRCNKRSTLRRFGTLDGRSLGPNEEPLSMPTVSYYRDTSMAKVSPVATVLSKEIAMPRETKEAEPKSSKIVVEPKNKTTLDKKMAKVVPKNSSAETSGRTEMIEKEKKIEEVKLTKEEIELEKKAEQQRRDEEAAILREQKRIEEIAKAKEALERKKRMAEKAQARAEFRARKEAEEKEKVREKRAKKKGKSRGSTSEIVETEPAVTADSASDTSREPEATEKPVTVVKRSTKALTYTKQMKITKSVLPPPPPVRNRGRNKIKPWWWLIFLAACLLALFFMGESNVFRYLSDASGSSS